MHMIILHDNIVAQEKNIHSKNKMSSDSKQYDIDSLKRKFYLILHKDNKISIFPTG
jgi:hypothetical protein